MRMNGKMCGLSAFQLKVIALVIMTIDHLGAYWQSGWVTAHYFYFRAVGRIAAPLFLFILVQSLRHTQSRIKFMRRLYIAGAAAGLFYAAYNLLLGGRLGIVTFSNIFFTFFYIAFYISVLEKLIHAHGKADAVKAIALFLAPFVVSGINSIVSDGILSAEIAAESKLILCEIADTVFPSIFRSEYGIVFIILGIVMYFAGTKPRQCVVYLAFCLLCICGMLGTWCGIISEASYTASTYFDLQQCFMVFAPPFMAVYSGARGRKLKRFFYVYYPAHQVLIHIAYMLTAV